MDEETLDLLEEGELFEVQANDHPEFPLSVTFDDEVAVEHDDALDAMVDALLGLAGVDRAVREDTEVLLVGGSMGKAGLEAWMTGWWKSRLAR